MVMQEQGWRVHYSNGKYSRYMDTKEQVLSMICPDLWRGEVRALIGPNGEEIPLQQLEKECQSRKM